MFIYGAYKKKTFDYTSVVATTCLNFLQDKKVTTIKLGKTHPHLALDDNSNKAAVGGNRQC